MKATDKNRQKLSISETNSANAKYNVKRWKINVNSISDYIEYMTDDKE